MKKHMIAFLLLVSIGILFTFSACTNTSRIEQPTELSQNVIESPEIPAESQTVVAPEVVSPPELHDIPAEKSIAKIVTPERYIKHELLPRYGEYIQVSNETGFPITHIDLFNDSLYRQTSVMRNLLGDTLLEDAQQFHIYLPDYPELSQALQEKDGNPFFVNAIDSDGDLYYLEWLPETEPWNIVIPFDAIDYSYQDTKNEPPEGMIYIENQTGYSLHSLFLRNPVATGSIDTETNLLGETIFQPGTRVFVATEEVPWIAEQLPFDAYGRVFVIAQDNEGDLYIKTWYPTSDRWIITLTLDDLSFIDLFNPTWTATDLETHGYGLQILNNTGNDIWFLYALTDHMYEQKELGDDILGDGIWDQGTPLGIDVLQLPYIQSSFMENPGQPVHLVAFTMEDVEYHMALPTEALGTMIELTGENLVP